MLLHHPWQRIGRVVPWIILILFLAFAGLAGYQFWNREREDTDPVLAQELAQAVLAVAETEQAAAGEWPQWRGPNRDGVSQETGFRTDWPKDGLPALWKAKAGEGFSSFAVAAGRVYTIHQDGDNEVVVCWEATSGNELWRFTYPCRFVSGNGSGPRSTPTVDGGRVYTVGGTGILHCLNAATGKEVWPKRHDLLQEFGASNLPWGTSFSPLVEGDLLLTNPGGPNGGSLAAFNKLTGELVWKSLDDRAGYSSPVAVTMAGVRQILFFTGDRLVSVDPKDGSLHWAYPWETSYHCNIATPIVVGDYVFISSGYGKGCGLFKVSRDDAGKLQVQRVYTNNRMKNHFSSSVYHQEHVYGFDEGQLTCMNFRTGAVVWKQRGFDKGTLLVADGYLIIFGENGKLALAEATPDGYREKASYRLVEGDTCWSAPVLADGRLYVRDQQQVFCLDLRRKAE